MTDDLSPAMRAALLRMLELPEAIRTCFQWDVGYTAMWQLCDAGLVDCSTARQEYTSRYKLTAAGRRKAREIREGGG